MKGGERIALDNCPHMTARCPHHREECNDSESKQCLYVKMTAASMVAATTSLRALGVDTLSPQMRKYLQEAEAFVSNTASTSR